MSQRTAKIVNTILYILLGIILAINLFILFQAKQNEDKVPAIFGYKPFIVMSGSMESEIFTNDLIFVETIDTANLKEGDIIAFRTSDNIVVTHRINKIYEVNGEKKFETKGDNNKNTDGDLVSESDVEGKYVKRIPKVGSWLLFISKPLGMFVAILVAIVIIFIYSSINSSIHNKKKSKEDEQYRREFEEFKRQQQASKH